MKKSIIKLISIYLCAAIAAGSCGFAVLAENQAQTAEQDLKDCEADSQPEKDETVYIIAGADGSVQKVIVSDWIKGVPSMGRIPDKSELSNIENLKGDEGFTVNSDNVKIWDAKGKDIYYRGTAQLDIPVNIRISYALNGKSVSPMELAGKSGRVTIRFDYENNQFEWVEIDGKKEKIYLPFAMLTGMIFDNDSFTDIAVTNGKLVNDGSRTAVIGIALPGLAESLGIDSGKAALPEYTEISANVKNFKMSSTVTVASNEIFNKLDPVSLDSIDSIGRSLSRLCNAMNQLLNGSGKLYSGLCALSEKSGRLIKGIGKLSAGAKELEAGAGALSDGAGELKFGSAQLYEGLNKLNSNSRELNAGANQIFSALLKEASSQIKAAGISAEPLTKENYSRVLTGIINSLDRDKIYEKARSAALKKVTTAVKTKKNEIRTAVTAAVKKEVEAETEAQITAQIKAKILAEESMTEDMYQSAEKAIKEQIDRAVKAGLESNEAKSAKSTLIKQTMDSEKIKAVIRQKTANQTKLLIEEKMNSDEIQSQINKALRGAESGAADIVKLKAQLDSRNQFCRGLSQYTAGVSQAASGAKALRNGSSGLCVGADRLLKGSAELAGGLNQLEKGSGALADGVDQLCGGAEGLMKGFEELNGKLSQTFAEMPEQNIKNLTERLRAVSALSHKYNNFSGIINEMNGRVKFIYRTQSVNAE